MSKVVLITGASRGIGRALALDLGRAGYCVGVNYRSRRAEAESVVAELRNGGAEADHFPADVSDPLQAKDLVDGVVRKWGKIDGLINNAGVTRDRSIGKMSLEEWRDVIDTNLSGPFYCLQSASHHMRRQKSGFIINIASILGVHGAVGCANYVAAKAGLIGLTKAAARELGRYNICVNAVLPGFHPTEMSEKIPPEQNARVLAQHSLGRSTDIKDLSRFVMNLTDLSTVSGQVFNVDSRIL
ncbi:MAG: SDR family NAD(P)-dependent oxidoreductase [Elusimicrobia bacterium]|nr:SDR family NAD(P)-dependent oxidoreductase [Elusimicrobiota bacterium]